MSSSSIMESLFQRTLEDLIKALRVQLINNTTTFLSKSLEEIKREIKSTDPQTKSIALQKLTYLNTHHALPMDWASFHVVEVMSFQSFSHKKIGYLAASQSFSEETEVLLLITNQLRKDLTSTNEFEVCLALEFLSIVASIDLARDLTPEIFTLLASSKNLVKKKSIAVVLRVFSKYPDAVRVLFKRLVENLESSNLQATSAVISVFCELALTDPRSYLPLAPEFYRILVDSKNNWILIKVLKIFAVLAPLEPRLGKRIVDPICDIMRRTNAKSLLFECARTVVSSLTDYDNVVAIAVEKIRELMIEEDPNLKYLGLRALSILMPKNPRPVLDNKELIVKALSDDDPNIQTEALNLVMGMVSEDNVIEISQILIHHSLKSNPEFCNKILGAILSTCSQNFYGLVVDFDWYVSLLGEVSRNPHCRHGEEIERQFVDIGLRVKDVRPELVQVCRSLLIDPSLLGNPLLHRILSGAAWVSGEYVEFSKNPLELMEALLQPRANLLPSSVRAVYIHAVCKVFISCIYSYLTQDEEVPSSDRCKAKSFESALNLEKDSASVEMSKMVEYVETEDAKDSSSINGFILGTSSFVHDRQGLEDSDSARCEASTDCKQGEVFNSKSNSDLQVLGNSALDKDTCSLQSILYLLNLVKMGVSPLLGGDDVEVHERARNVLGLICALEEIPGFMVGKEGDSDNRFSINKENSKASGIIKLMHEIFLEELGPVSVNAQERVPIPDGLVLNEDLADLATLIGDDLPLPNTFSIGVHQGREWDAVSLNNAENKEESEPSSESTSLLAQHRKKHGLYYLSTEKDVSKSNDYPPANVSESSGDLIDAIDSVKLTAESLIRKKPNRTKPRPVVVKLDEGDGPMVPAAKHVKESKDDLLSGAIRDILLGDGSKPSSSNGDLRKKVETEILSPMDSQSRRNTSDKSSKRRKNKVLEESSVGAEKTGHGSSSSRRKKHSPKNDHHQTKPKSRQREGSPLHVAPQAPVIRDFLL